MSLFWLLIYALLIFVAINGYMIYNEKYQYNTSWPYPNSHQEMVDIAKKKKDHEMNDEEFNIKYAAFRHEMFRFSLFSKSFLRSLNYIFYYIELYLLHGGPNRLKLKYPIKQPIFIIGDFRSGTSVLERLISHHNDVTFFEMSHQALWCGPYLWSKFLNWMGFIRQDILGHKAFNRPNNKGMYYPHSSNVLLHRGRPFEIENLWEFCRQNLTTKRISNWNILDDPEKNKDNKTNMDILDENFVDKEFETLFINSIRLILANHSSKSKNPRFILKNPLNGYRIGFLYKLFPDCKFIHIARNPLKTTLSQIRMAQSNLRCFFMKEKECRINNNRPPPKKNNKNSWNYVFNNKYPNQECGTLWFPRQFPRTIPEYQKITKFIKEDKYECAVAVAVTQHERVALEAFKRIGVIEGKNKLTVWHEDILSNASLTFKIVMDYLKLKCTDKQRLEWLELEDFPGGQANKIRVKQSNKTEKSIDFGKDTKQVTEIIQSNHVMKRYKERIKIQERISTLGNGVKH